VVDLETAGFSTQTHRSAPDAISVTPAASVDQIPGFSGGRLSVQDPAAQLAFNLLGVQSGHRVLDACAAPGGKACHILERVKAVNLTAVDQSAVRMVMLRENLDRLRLDCDLVVADASEPSEWWSGVPFNRVLLDAPCSATGVIRRHPEIKWLRQQSQVAEAVQLQRRLLHRLWPLLEPGGILVYATCSVLDDENEKQIDNFLSSHPDAREDGPDVDWGLGLEHGRQILPGDQGMDGFYYASLRKTP
jgi:16S rRNA (cytosine967-C5)-methyltransferase